MTVIDHAPVAGVSLADAARGFVPRIRDLALKMERDRKLDDDLVADMDAAGLFSVIAPKRWGGAGQGPHEVNAVIEQIAHGDVSTAWVTGFYNLHNWFLCRYPLEVQEELFADRNSVRTAAILSKPGTGERVGDQIRVNGRWGYATGMLHASHAMVPVMIDGEMCWALVPREQLQIIEDWDMTAMAATGSVTIEATDALVPANRAMPFAKMMSADDHDGTFHDEEVMRLPFSVLTFATASLYVGALDAGVEMAKDRMDSASGTVSPPRKERSIARVTWVNAYQTARILHLVRDAATQNALDIYRQGRPQTLEEEARAQLHILTLRHSARDALRSLVDGNGTSGYRADNHLRRMASDIAMVSTHAVHGEYDVMMDRYARWLLGMGVAPGDPGARMT